MTLTLRLQRHGRKSRPFYHIVAADIRSPRDGRFKEKLGYYDPNPDPSVIEIDAPRLQHYYRNGAQISPAVRNLTRIKQIALSRTAATEATASEEAQDTSAPPAAEIPTLPEDETETTPT